MVTYDKPHLTYEQQLARLVERGMPYRDHAAALSSLKRTGYYRLSAYTYSFRKRDADGVVESQFVDGSSLEAAVDLHDFDVKLRATLLAGLEAFEVALRVQIAYTLGRRDKYGHLDPENALDGGFCGHPADSSDPGGRTRYDIWLTKYDKRCKDAEREDFVKHFKEKYDGRLPIWAATEVMDLGLIARLYGFLLRDDRVKISRNFGPRREPDFRAWTKSLNLLRNHCAHGDRIWNRSFTYTLPEFATGAIDSRLDHLASSPDLMRRKLYSLAAVLASVLTTVDPYSNWPRSFATQAKKLPGVPQVVTHQMMGFPSDWQELELWKYQPVARGR
ncbi:Abi family protein [Mycolicibacterium sarraceniae]|uniref:Abi family protein n=1 Tax=Mycolicibacterium sarraceniae TaxID=1534348 RepID=A0A7I7SPI8_9MYCO|nr:Abi family protein [Mycolicibacterium sarraceniae]BBY58450.1 abi family protein [Mycolicibacterium sarraceniae]